jgi:HNH endonuclease
MATPRLCSVDGCGKPHKGRGLCEMHLARLKHHGSTDEKPRGGYKWTKENPRRTKIDEDWLRTAHVAHQRRVSDIALEIGCAPHVIVSRLKEFGIPKSDGRAGRKAPKVRHKLPVSEVVSLYVEEKMSCANIGKIYGVTDRPVKSVLENAGVKIRHHNDTKRGVKTKNRIEIDASKALKRYSEIGVSKSDIAREFGVSVEVINRVLRENGVATKPFNLSVIRLTGEGHPSWKHDLTDEQRSLRRDHNRCAIWRKKVFKRDSFKCLKCGDDKGGNLEAHHIEGYSHNAEKRFDVSNGATLCTHCHRNFHSVYGIKSFCRNDFEEFLRTEYGSEFKFRGANRRLGKKNGDAAKRGIP